MRARFIYYYYYYAVEQKIVDISAALPATFGRGAMVGSPPLSARGEPS